MFAKEEEQGGCLCDTFCTGLRHRKRQCNGGLCGVDEDNQPSTRDTRVGLFIPLVLFPMKNARKVLPD